MTNSSVSPALPAALSFCLSLPVGARVGVVGSRGFAPLSLVGKFVASLPDSCVIVSGAARGVDRAAAVAARSRGLAVCELAADWSKGRSAGVVRNAEIVRSSDVLVAFWDGVSPGTASSVEMARRAGVPVFVVSPPAVSGGLVQASLF